MKKRICIVLLCALLLVALFPLATARADDGLSFLAVNDYLPPELINVLASYGGATYVPCWLFTNYSLGVYYSYFSSNSTAYLYNANTQIFFELPTGKTYDSNDVQYSAPAIMWGGTVYLPLSFVCNAFGTFTYRMIGSNEYGSILRISNGSEALTDDEFFRAAQNAMRRYYQSRKTEATPTPVPTLTPTPVPTPVPTPTPTEKPTREGDTVRLGLFGLPTAATLELLRRQNVDACFFVSAEEIRSNADMIRRIACEGFSLGVSGPDGSGAGCEEAAALLWEAARVRTILAVMSEASAKPDGMVVFPAVAPETDVSAQEAAYTVTSALDATVGDQTVIFPTGGEDLTGLRILFYYFRDMKFTVSAIREIDGGGTPVMP